MFSGTDLKYWLRSGSWQFAMDRTRRSDSLSELSWQGKPIFYRPGTSDVTMIHHILLRPGPKREYHPPKDLEPEIILDIGANIGISSILLADQYPNAKIYAFEPVESNFRILEKNIRMYPNIRIFPYALGAADKEQEIYLSDDESNLGGFSFHDKGVRKYLTEKVRMREINSALGELDATEIDLIKVDTEGCEYEILCALSPKLLQSVSWIIGELHGQKDFELLGYLSQWFDIAIHKSLRNRLSHFEAARRSS